MDVELNKEIDYYRDVCLQVKKAFSRISNTLKNREVEVLRELKVYSQYLKLTNSYEAFQQISVALDKEVDIVNLISTFASVDFSVSDSEFCKIEDYQKPDDEIVPDNEIVPYDKCVEDADDVEQNELPVDPVPETVPMEEPAEVSVILECIEKRDPNLCLHQTISDEPTDCDSRAVRVPQRPGLNGSTSVPNLCCKCDAGSRTPSRADAAADASDRLRALSMKHPMQVQQWMKQIILETETEPVSNHIMEHSHIRLTRKESV